MRDKILWLDSLAGLAVGILVLSLSNWLSTFLGLPRDLLHVTGAANLIYGCYSLTLAMRKHRPMTGIKFLVFANLSWTVACVVFFFLYRENATVFGKVLLLGEGLFVGCLAVFEWKWRADLTTNFFR